MIGALQLAPANVLDTQIIEDLTAHTSGTMLETPVGSMQGSYHMVTDDGVEFDTEISPFTLSVPHTLH